MNETAIRWTEFTWNPASGCEKITAGCKHCYAETLAEQKRGTPAFPVGFDLTLRPHKLREPFKLKVPSLIFVNSMSDLFWEKIDDEYRDKVVDVMEQTPQHQYQVLTKRHENMLRYSKRRKLPPNFWAGVTVEDQANADERIPILLQVEAEIRFLSCEPILGPISLARWILSAGTDGEPAPRNPQMLHWVIFGGESGAHLTREPVNYKRGLTKPWARSDRTTEWRPREDRLPWARTLRNECSAAGVSFFFKQWGGPRSHSGGHLLDGNAYEELPRLPAAAEASPRGRNYSLPVVT